MYNPVTTIKNSKGEDFSVGDVVKLKGGTIKMVINHIQPTPPAYKIAELNQPEYYIYCKYEKNNKVVDGQPFNIDALEKA